MADLYGAAQSPTAADPPPPPSETEEISSFLHQFLQNQNQNTSSSASSSSAKFMFHHPHFSSPPPHHQKHLQPHPDAAFPLDFLDRQHRLAHSNPDCPNPGVNFSDPGLYFSKDALASDNAAAAGSKRRGVAVEDDLGSGGDFSCDSGGGEASEMPTETVRPRGSSKRSRAAEVHNLSEKRRRSRINEKMKALQNLIPNSNKTDKASMLDEAIEYLKQLQLQVQMLTLRNGLSLHPMCLPPGVLQPMQLPLTGLSFEEGNNNGLLTNSTLTAGSFSATEQPHLQTGHNLPHNQCTVSNGQPSGTNLTASENPFAFEQPYQVLYESLHLTSSGKEICREGTADRKQTVNNSSPGVS